MVHTEIHTANTLLSSDGRIVLLDLDGCGMGPAPLETGYPLIACFVEDSAFHRDWASAFYEGYTGGDGMTDKEKELVFAAGLLHGLRHVLFAPRFCPEELVPRWDMIQCALAHKAELLAAIPNPI